MTKQEIIKQISKPSTLFKVGGFKPSDDIKSSWFGKVLLSKEGEKWPDYEGDLMTPLCQLNLSNLPYKLEVLKDINFITVFVDEEKIFNEDDNRAYLIRAYQNIEELVPLEQAEYSTAIKAFQLEPYLSENDCPCWDDCPISIPEEFEDNYEGSFENRSGIKIGGWPSLVQGEIFWSPFNKDAEDVNFAFQIDSIEKANWHWGDGGVGYFGINPLSNEWFFTWQGY